MTWRLAWIRTRKGRGISGSCEEILDHRLVDMKGLPIKVQNWIMVERAGLDVEAQGRLAIRGSKK